ncbi:ribonuclease H-like domain-containing protein [Tanacetum coccineum]
MSCILNKKYCHELLHEHGLLVARPVDIPLPKTSILSFDETNDDKYLSDFTTYQKLVGKLIYLTNTRHDISYVVHCLSQHMHSPLQSHFKAALRTRLSILKLEGILLNSIFFWVRLLCHGKAKNKLVYLKVLLKHDTEIAANPVFHERTKHFELDVHFVREKVLAGINKTMKVSSDLQTADIFTKSLGVVQHILCCKKLGMLDVFIGELVGKDSWRKIHVLKKGKKIQAHQPEGGKVAGVKVVQVKLVVLVKLVQGRSLVKLLVQGRPQVNQVVLFKLVQGRYSVKLLVQGRPQVNLVVLVNPVHHKAQQLVQGVP